MAKKAKDDGVGRGKAWCKKTIDIEELIAHAVAKEVQCRTQTDTKGGQG